MAAFGAHQRFAGNVGGNKVDHPALGGKVHFVQHHGDGIGFLSGGATGRPDAQSFTASAARQHLRQQVLQRLELRRIAEEGRVVDGDGFGERGGDTVIAQAQFPHQL